MPHFTAKKLLPRPPPFHRRHNRQAEYLSLSTNQICDELNLGHFHTHDHRDVHNLDELHTTAPVVAHNGHVNDLVQSFKGLQLWERGCLLHVCTRELAGPAQPTSICTTTGMSTTWSKNSTSCNCGTSTVFCSSKPKRTCRRNNGHVTTLAKNCNCGIPGLHCLDQNPCLAQQRARQPCP